MTDALVTLFLARGYLVYYTNDDTFTNRRLQT